MAKVSERIRTTLSKTGGAKRPGSTLREAFVAAEVNVLGSGMYGVAIEDGGDVFKIFGSEEVGYGAFLKFLKGKSSVLLPKVKVVGQFGNYTCASVERLYSMEEMGNREAWYFAEWVSAVAYNYLAKKHGQGCGGRRAKFPAEAEQYVNRANMIGLIKKMVDWMVTNQYDCGFGLDIHYGNFMLRHNADGTKQVVITDPFCNLR